MLAKDMTELIGMTPMVRLSRYEALTGMSSGIYAKIESFNPTGSAKDRAALGMIEDAEKRGLLKEGSVIIEPTSGNTGIGLCAIAAVRGYRCIIVMPDTMSVERQKLMKAFGAEVVLTDGAKGMNGAIEKAEELSAACAGSFIPGQFDNPANAEAHYRTTARELWEDMDGKIDVFIASVGTGGTLTGCARYLKEKDPLIRVIAVEPAGSPFLSEGRAGAHKIQGIGAGFVPGVLDTDLYDEVVAVTDDEAYEETKRLACCEGLLCGISSGSVLAAARKISEGQDRPLRIALILPDTGERYLSTQGLF
ncbi:MAG: cysteine synthase A [Eubacteriaceae bacterium]|nr:cysteine synthase A [Eubacteriaceae bacterium]